MRRRIFFILVIYTSYLFITGCHKNSDCEWAAEPYAIVLFQLYKNGKLVTDSNFLASLRLYYYQNNQKSYIPIQGITNANTNDTNVFYKNRVMLIDILSTLKVKQYYLEYPNNSWTTDSLYVDYLSPSPSTNCEYKLNTIKYNETVPNDTTIYYEPVYVFNKQ